jgi:hypothetical protein
VVVLAISVIIMTNFNLLYAVTIQSILWRLLCYFNFDQNSLSLHYGARTCKLSLHPEIIQPTVWYYELHITYYIPSQRLRICNSDKLRHCKWIWFIKTTHTHTHIHTYIHRFLLVLYKGSCSNCKQNSWCYVNIFPNSKFYMGHDL